MLKKIKDWFKNNEIVKKVKTSIKDFIKKVDPESLCRILAFLATVFVVVTRIVKMKKASKEESIISMGDFINNSVKGHNSIISICDKDNRPTEFKLADLGKVGEYFLDSISINKDCGITKNMDIYGIIVYGG